MTIPHLVTLMMAAIPLLLLFSATTTRRAARWRLVQATNTATLLISAAVACVYIHGKTTGRMPPLAPWVNPSIVSPLLLVVVNFIGLIIASYSRNYLAGERMQGYYLNRLQLTLSAVTVVVITNHLLVLLLAWVGISLGLHQLLLFYPDRPRAVLAAHKKFLFARLAELCLLTACLLLHARHGTWLISDIMAACAHEPLSNADRLAAVLLALTALIKCAQLPMHGWLMQVMEAPTPVSALLHAGIVNLGGYLFLLFAPLMTQAPAARWLVLVVSGPTMVLASLVMMTRVSIKVKLAWSTCAQMALMLVECALGLYQIAFLHLAAHSWYKAYSFLNAGTAVERSIRVRLAPAPTPSAASWVAAVSVAGIVVFGAIHLSDASGAFAPWVLLLVALTLLLGARGDALPARPIASATPLALIVASAYTVQKAGIGMLIPSSAGTAGPYADLWVITLILVLVMCYWLIRYRPSNALANRFSVWLFAGFYLDEWSTRTTLRIWPARLPNRAKIMPVPSLEEEVNE